jgi:5-methylcytosine-specific restriction endonuclease McrA
MKRCSKCQVEKELDQFNKNRSSYDGYENQCRACRQEYYQKTKKARLAHGKQYRETHELKDPARHRELTVDSVARRKGADREALCDHEACKMLSRRVVWGRDEGRCRIKLKCDGDYIPFEKMELDHVIPYTEGGKHCYYNVQTSCMLCNRAKYNYVLERAP